MFSVEHVNQIRRCEIARIVRLFPPGSRILEFGAGTGMQSLELSRLGFDVTAIDLVDSNYARYLVFAVQPYDGRTIPFADASFNVVFSSNVLEHIRDLDAAYREFARVLKPGGFCVHVMPTHTWKIWSVVTSCIDAAVWALQFLAGKQPFRVAIGNIVGNLVPLRHGAGGSTWSEFWTFSPQSWRRQFRHSGYSVIDDWPMALFYTGSMLVGTRISLVMRRRLSRVLGSSTHVFKVAPPIAPPSAPKSASG